MQCFLLAPNDYCILSSDNIKGWKFLQGGYGGRHGKYNSGVGMSSAVANGLAGAGGGIIAQIITYPLQTVNTRQQTERVAKKGRIKPDGSLPPSNRPAGGTLLQILQVIRSEGWGGLYSGLRPSLLGTAASQGIYYYFYQLFKNKAEATAASNRDQGRGDGTVGMFSWLIVAAIAGSLNVLLTNPIWVLVTRMQTHTQAERKIMEGKREALMREASEIGSIDSYTLQDKLDELDSMKPRPYGTLHAVGIASIPFIWSFSSFMHIIHGMLVVLFLKVFSPLAHWWTILLTYLDLKIRNFNIRKTYNTL
ncbi:hypothetical protein L1049_025896 [Liquidambar formosana]|uniref:Uncharacterized protein n=1 Tax=Liquidambar formosana TaxID=63359 RepID=A0AAP0NCD1_LIQFO